MSFLVLSTPRSRSYWLSKFLSYPPNICSHDLILECNSLKDLVKKISSVNGSVELSLGIAWKTILNLFPETKIVVLRRPLHEVILSLKRHNIYIPLEELSMRDNALKECSRHPNVKAITFDDLNDPDCRNWLFKYCLGLDLDKEWDDDFVSKNIQLDLNQRMTLVKLRFPIIQKITLEACAIDTSLKEYYVS